MTPEVSALFEKLRSWRASTAKEKSVPAYVVFHDSTLRQIAEDRPVDLDGLAGISGIGQAKLASYGGEVLRILAGEGGDVRDGDNGGEAME
jgi:ATP-dependent DNA helicase RecQ